MPKISREKLERAYKAAQNIVADGTSEHESGYGPPYGPPFFITDTSSAEPEVNHRGELIETVKEIGQVSRRLLKARIDRMMEILNGT